MHRCDRASVRDCGKTAHPLRMQIHLVTGGAGFLGSHLIDRLMEHGDEVICLDNYFTGRSMDVYVAKLRKYLKVDESLRIENVHGEGFRLVQD